MKFLRFRIGDLMVLSLVAAADFAAGRTIVAHNQGQAAYYWLASLMPMAIALQCLGIWLRASQTKARTFWFTTLVVGTLALGSVLWLYCDPPTETMTISASGTTREIYPGGLAARVWAPYLDLVYAGIERLGLIPSPPVGGRPILVVAVVLLVPQVLIALGAGLVIANIAKRIHSPPEIPTGSRPLPKWLKQVVSIAMLVIMPLIMSGALVMRDRSNTETDMRLPSVQPIVDDLPFVEMAEDTNAGPPKLPEIVP